MSDSKKKKSRIGKVFKVGAVPAVATGLLTTGVIIPATVFSANIIGTTTMKSKEATIKQYNKIYHDMKWDKAMSMTQDNIVGPFKVNGADSHVWKITKHGEEHKPVTKAMIFVHGLRNSHWNAITFARQMLDRGYVVYCYDQRESGENIDNGKISFGQNEAVDLNNLYENVIDYKNNPGLDQVIVYGQSNGAGTTLSFAEKYQDSVSKAKALRGISTNFMIESGFVSGHQAMDGLVKGFTHTGKLLSWMTTPQMKNTMNEFMGVKSDFNYKDNINKINENLYIAHGVSDKVIPVDQARSLSSARSNKNATMYHEWNGLGHIGVSLAKDSQDEMFSEAIPFLESSPKMMDSKKLLRGNGVK